MASGELEHKNVGSQLTSVEFHAVGGHVLDSQATGDIIIANSATQLSRLAKGTQGYPLVMGASVPQWGGAITFNGIITINGQVFDAGSGYVEIDTTGKVGLVMDGGIYTGGAGVFGRMQNRFGGNFLSDGGSDYAVKVYIDGRLTGAIGDTAYLTTLTFEAGITTQGNSETIGVVSQVYFREPSIIKGSGDTITVAATVYIKDAPTEGETNAALYVAAGATHLQTTYFHGALIMADQNIDTGTVTGCIIGYSNTRKLAFFGATPVLQQAHIADPAGGGVVDTECRAALNTLLSYLDADAGLGLLAGA